MTTIQARPLSPAIQIHSINKFDSNLQNNQHRSSFRILFVQKGTGWLLTKSGKQLIHDNWLIWLCPAEAWTLHLDSGAEGYHLVSQNCSRQFPDYDPQLIYHPQFLRLLTTVGAMPINTETGCLFEMLFKTMSAELASPFLFAQEIVQRYFKLFMLHLLRSLERVEQKKMEEIQADIVQRFQDLLEKNFRTKKQVSDYATQMFISPNYLNAIVRRLTGHPVSYHIKQRIVLEAKRKGAYTDMCMKQVAYELGFDDIPHFSKYFKAATGMNFTDFKQAKYWLPMAG